MGNSLSQDSQAILEAAVAGDAHLLKQQIAYEPKLLGSVTLLKRRGVLHLAAKEGHPQVVSTVLEPLLVAVREEYHAHMEEEKQRQQAEQTQQQQQQEGVLQAQEECSQQQHEQQLQSQPSPQQQQQQGTAADQSQRASTSGRQSSTSPQQQQQQQQQQPELQLPSFKRLRSTVNARDLYRRTPLLVAAKHGHLECAQLLADAAANIFAVDREGNTSLHYAALHGHAVVVEYLLQRAADRGLGPRFVNKRNLSGFTALHYAVWSCQAGTVVPLLAAGADICAVNDRVFDAWVPVPIGSSPLHLAVMRASVPVAMLLLQHYVLSVTSSPRERPRPTDPRTLVNLYGMNPAQLAGHRNQRQMAQLLMPSTSLSRVLSGATPPPARVFGPQSLKTIATAVLQQALTQKLDSLEAAQAQSHCSSSASSGCKASGHTDTKACCSLVCVQACSTDDAEAGRGTGMPQMCSTHSADVDLIVVQADVSPESTPASSRAASPADSNDALGAAGSAAEGSGRSGPSAASCHSPARSDTRKAVTFSAVHAVQQQADAADEATCCAEEPAPALPRALTSASSSGWYDELCCVCWESEVTAVLEPCMHAMCLGCARQLVGCKGTAGPQCPLCRAHIAGFEAVPPDMRQQEGRRKKSLLAGAGI